MGGAVMMTDKLVLSKDHSYSTDSKETGLNNNVAVIGCTGSGKTCSVVIPRLLNTFETNLILTDPKRELIDKFAPLLSSRGYNVIELNLDNPSKSDICFDPLYYTESSDDISRLASSVINILPSGEKVDKFWDYSSMLLAEFIMRFTLQFKENASFADFLLESRTIEEKENSSSVAKLSVFPVMEDYEEYNPNHPLTACYRNMHEIAGKTLASVMISMRTILSRVFNSEIEDMIRNKPSLNIERFILEKTILFITTDGSNEGVDAYVNLIYETLLQTLMKKAREYPEGRLPIPVHLIMDDFACGARINSFPKMISSFRSKAISSTIILQDESQLVSMFGEYGARTILNNNDTLVYLGGNDIKTARDMSERLNLPLEEMLYMPIDCLYFFRRGQTPVKTKRYPLFEDAEYIKICNQANANLTSTNVIKRWFGFAG